MIVERKEVPSQQLLNEHLRYDADTGLLWWRIGDHGRILNRHVGCTRRDKGRMVMQFRNKVYYVHRIVWCMHYGHPVPDVIDHIDRDATNNRLNNLREATFSINNLNTNYGVTYRRGGWRLRFRNIDKIYRTEAEALAAREQLLKEHGVIA